HEGQLPSQSTLIKVEPPALVVSAIKQSEASNGMIVRIYNPLSHTVEATIQPDLACTQAFVTNLNEEPAGHPQGVPLHIELRSGEIVTVLFQLKPGVRRAAALCRGVRYRAKPFLH